MILQSQRRRLAAISSMNSDKIWTTRIGSSSNGSCASPPYFPSFVGSTAATRTTYYSVLAHSTHKRRPVFLSTVAFWSSIPELKTKQQLQQQPPHLASLLFSTQAATTHAAAAAASTAVSSTDSYEQTKALLQQQQHDDESANHLVKAQEILTRLQEQQQLLDDDDPSHRSALTQCRASLFHAWIQWQDALLTRLELLDDDDDDEEQQDNGVHHSSRSSNASAAQLKNNHQHHQYRVALLRQAVQAVKAAHDVLESMEPQLAPQHVVLQSAVHVAAVGGVDEDDMVLSEANFLQGGEGGEGVDQKTATSSTATRTRVVSSSPLSSTNKDENLDIALLGQTVLQAWARLLEVAAAFDDATHRGGDTATNNATTTSLLHRSRAMRGIPQRAQFLLERMVAMDLLKNGVAATTKSQRNKAASSTKSKQQQHPQVADATEFYNAVLKAWAYSQEHLRGVMAERVFQEMLQSSSNPGSSGIVATPNGDSYRFIIRAWSWSRDRRAAFTATGHFMKMLRHLERSHVSTPAAAATWARTSTMNNDLEDNDESAFDDDVIVNDMEPTLEDYHVLLQAWTRAEDKMSPTKAQSVLRLMENAHDNGYTTIRPDADCYLYVLQTCAQRPTLFDLGHAVVNEIFQKLKNELIIPNAATYDAAISVWKNCALHPDANEFRQDCVEKTVDLLEEMRMSNQKANSNGIGSGAGGVGVGGQEGYRGITTENINHVLEALTVSSDSRRAEQAEALLKEMEDNLTSAATATTLVPTPNAHSYRLVLNVWNSTNDREKLTRAKAILWRMKDHLLQGRHGKMPQQSRRNRRHGTAVVAPVDVLNAFVHLCASFNIENQEEGMILIREVLAAVSTLKSSGLLHPNAASYTAILQAARKLLPLGPGRQHVVEQIFILARDDGMVNETVLQELMAVATSDQYARLVIAPSHDMEGTTRVVPEEWTRNAFGNGHNSNNKGRVLSADGRRSHPLAVDGQMKMTKAMQDFKMRRLRDKRNRNLLRGGRWDRSQDKETNNSSSTVVSSN